MLTPSPQNHKTKVICLLSLVALLSGCQTLKYEDPGTKLSSINNKYFSQSSSQQLEQVKNVQKILSESLSQADSLLISQLISASFKSIAANQADNTIDQNKLEALINNSAFQASVALQANQKNSNTTQSASSNVNIQYTPGLFGVSELSSKFDSYSIEQSNIAKTEVLNALAYQVYYNYVQYKVAFEKIKVIKDSIALMDSNVNIASYKEKSGLLSESSVNALRASRIELQASLQSVIQNQQVYANALFAIISDSYLLSRVLAESKASDLTVKIPPGVNVSITVDSVTNRPDVKKAELALHQAWIALKAAGAAKYPQLSFNGSILLTSSTEALSLSNLGWNTSLALTAPIFNANKLNNTEKLYLKKYDQAALSYEATVKAAISDIGNKSAQVSAASQQYSLNLEYTSNIESQSKGLALKNELGMISPNVLNDSRISLNNQALTSIDYKSNYALSLAALLYSCGAGIAPHTTN